MITRKKRSLHNNSNTRKSVSMEKLNKCPRSRIVGMESYKINCGKNLLIGYHSIKASEETSTHKDNFVSIILSKLHDYDKPVVIKVYDENNFHLNIEKNVLEKVNGFRNTATLICDFACDDDKNKYIRKIKKQIRFCSKDGQNKLHFFIYEFIAHGDVSDYLGKPRTNDEIKSLILQIVCVIIQLAFIYRIYHGDINTGNILIDQIDDETVDYSIEDETFTIQSHGIIPKIIDYGRSNFYREPISNNEVWFDVILALGVIYPYIQNIDLRQIVLDISKHTDLDLPSIKDYYRFIYSSINRRLSRETK